MTRGSWNLVGACLAHFFFPPIFPFRIYDPLNCLALFTFLVMVHVATRLVSNARKTLHDNEKRVAPHARRFLTPHQPEASAICSPCFCLIADQHSVGKHGAHDSVGIYRDVEMHLGDRV